jgi:hypothetical protein
VTLSLCGLLYATVELGFLCVVRAESIKRGLHNNTSSSVQFSSAVELRVQFKAIERPVRSAVQLRLLHGLRKDYRVIEDNRIQRKIQG